jgi:dCMP deaminase
VGKSTIADFLIREQGFTRLYLTANSSSTELHSLVASKFTLATKDDASNETEIGKVLDAHVFTDAEVLLDFVTSKWNENWVTTDIHTDEIAEMYSKRPFFLLVSVDAPVTSRFERFTKQLVKYVYCLVS